MRDVITKNHFTLCRERFVPDVGGRLWELEHQGSGARLAWLEREDENMTFSISFQTIPEDSTGVFHILEHSVLCGSEKYPCKEPFVELMKGSLNTFLNAMTFSDKTMYPVSSRNRQDFLNLISVYMDAVLHPAIYHRPEIFRQEGWHYELAENGAPAVQGVVYNEMRGMSASVETVLDWELCRRLFPDTCYRHVSGGDPEHIPELTYERFLACHQRFYHPSNAFIILDGSVDLDPVLALLDSCLSPYERREPASSIALQTPVPYTGTEVPYEIGPEEDPAGRVIVSRACLLCTFSDLEELLAAQILASYLTGDSEGPLKRAVLDAGLGENAVVRVHSGIRQPFLSWEVWNTSREKLSELIGTVRTTLAGLAERGLDRRRLAACRSRLAFSLQDRDSSGFPRGLMETFSMIEAWLYGGDPAQNLCFQDALERLEAKENEGYFEDLIRRVLLDDAHGVLVCMIPSPSLGQDKQRREAQRLASIQAAWSSGEQEALLADNARLSQWQRTPDPEAAIAAIPTLKLSDLSAEPRPLPVAEERLGQVPLLRHDTGGGLVYLDLFFSASDLTVEELPVAALLCALLGRLPTAAHDSAGLQLLLKQKTGDLGFSVEVYGVNERPDLCRVLLAARCVCLKENQGDAAELMSEILTETVFQDRALLRDTLRQLRISMQRSLVGSGNQFAVSRTAACQTAAGVAGEYLSGVSYIRWLMAQGDPSDDGLDRLLNQMEAIAGRVFARERLTLSVSGNAEAPALGGLVQTIPATGGIVVPNAAYPLLPVCRQGLVIPSDVAFAVKSGSLSACGQTYSGRIPVLSKLLSLEYLWNAIRVQGGAYGAGFYGTDAGLVTFYTYRDPNPARSLDCFDHSADFLRDFLCQDRQLDKLILGAVADTDPLLGAQGRIRLAESRYFKELTQADICRIRRELLSTTRAELLELCTVLDAAAADAPVCVAGGRALLEACGNRLEEIQDLTV